MKRSFLAAACLLTLLMAVPGSAQTYGALLTGLEEVPLRGVADGFGSATITINADNSITANITVSRIGATITAAHIHTGAAGVAGPVLVGLISSTNTFQNGVLNSTIPAVPVEFLNLIRANPSGFYVNVHTLDFPGGSTIRTSG